MIYCILLYSNKAECTGRTAWFGVTYFGMINNYNKFTFSKCFNDEHQKQIYLIGIISFSQ